jgi:hypothetical protein
LRFEMSAPQYYQYVYEATPSSFVAQAHGDLDGNAVFSTFAARGTVSGDRVVLAPTLDETDPEE